MEEIEYLYVGTFLGHFWIIVELSYELDTSVTMNGAKNQNN